METVYKIIDNDFTRCREWLKEQKFSSYVEEICIGLERNGELVSCTSYGKFNGKSMHAHIAIKPGQSLTKTFTWFMFYYPFIQCGVDVLVSWHDESQEKAIKLARHLGFKEQCRFKDICYYGDIIISTLKKEDCKWLGVKL